MARKQNEAPATENTEAGADEAVAIDGTYEYAGKTAQYKVGIFDMKKGTEVPEKFDGVKIQIRLAADTDDAVQALANMLAMTNGDVQAVLDAFNGQGVALTRQKAVKAVASTDGVVPTDKDGKPIEGAEAPTVTVDDLQKVADETVIEKVKRGRASEQKRIIKAKAEKADEIESATSDALSDLRALRDEGSIDEAEAQLALMKRLKVVAADVTLDTL